jgi:hypothetical protein
LGSELWQFLTDVSGRPIGSIFRVRFQNVGKKNTKTRCVMTQKSEVLKQQEKCGMDLTGLELERNDRLL